MCLYKQADLHGTSPDAGSRHDSRCSRGERPGHPGKRPEAGDYASATAPSRLAGQGISRQAFTLQAKILQVDRRVRHTRHRVVEAHPKASFAQLAGAPAFPQINLGGIAERCHLLTEAGIVLPGALGPADEKAAIDDVLDTAVAAWTAARVIQGQALSHPDPPEVFSGGLACAIWT